MLRQNGEAVNQGPDHGADSSCLDTWCCAGVDRELGKDREGLVRAHLELARLALRDLRPEHYGEMPWMCFCELQIRDARFDEAIFGRRGAFVFLPKRRGEEAESLGRDLSQDCLLVGEVAVRLTPASRAISRSVTSLALPRSATCATTVSRSARRRSPW